MTLQEKALYITNNWTNLKHDSKVETYLKELYLQIKGKPLKDNCLQCLQVAYNEVLATFTV